MIKERIIQVVEFKGIAKEIFYSKIGMTSASFRGKAKETPINSNAIENILSEIPDLNPLWLLTGNGSMLLSNKPYNEVENDIFLTQEEEQTDYGKVVSKVPTVVTVDQHGKDNIVLVPIKAAAGYLNSYDNPTFIKKLPTYNLPNLRNGIFRMFEVKGHSMVPTLHQGSFVVGQFVENWTIDMKDDRVYVIVSKTEGIIVKRCMNRIEKYNSIFCKSDNRAEYPSYSIDPHDIKEVWEVKLSLLSNLPNPAEVFDRINDLEADVHFLKEKLLKKIDK